MNPFSDEPVPWVQPAIARQGVRHGSHLLIALTLTRPFSLIRARYCLCQVARVQAGNQWPLLLMQVCATKNTPTLDASKYHQNLTPQ